ncbi:hypothetical protein ACIBTV_27525 [Micromonospora sp. NPDC049366]|uniref:hypothetical protein n=1 Tax=Micromonospora sp. NPDC049366 TaxID=3364271 RepID=UPI003796FE52
MSVHIVLSCDRQLSEGVCAEQIRVFGAGDEAAARRAAGGVGWHHSGAGDRCPRCSGRAYSSPPLIVAQSVTGGPR